MKHSYVMNGETVEVEEIEGVAAVRGDVPAHVPRPPWPEGLDADAFRRSKWKLVATKDADQVEGPRARVYRQDGRIVLGLGVSCMFDEALTEAETEARVKAAGLVPGQFFRVAPNLLTGTRDEQAVVRDPMDVIKRLRAIPGCKVAEPEWLEQIGPRGSVGRR